MIFHIVIIVTLINGNSGDLYSAIKTPHKCFRDFYTVRFGWALTFYVYFPCAHFFLARCLFEIRQQDCPQKLTKQKHCILVILGVCCFGGG